MKKQTFFNDCRFRRLEARIEQRVYICFVCDSQIFFDRFRSTSILCTIDVKKIGWRR